MPFLKKIKCIMKNDFIINKTTFQWNKKIFQAFSIHICIDCWSNDCHPSWSFKWYATSYNEWLQKFTCFLQAVIFIFFLWKIQDHHLCQCRFLIHHWISFSSNCPHCMHSLAYVNLTFFCLFWFSFGFSLNKFHFIRQVFYSSVTNIDLCCNSFVFPLWKSFMKFSIFFIRIS